MMNWTLGSAALTIDGIERQVDAAFIRHDVFDALANGRASTAESAYGWFSALSGWCWSVPTLRWFNGHLSMQATNKIAVLHAARQMGLPVPATHVSNSQEITQRAGEHCIVKPVAGGTYCETQQKALDATEWRVGRAATPALLQERLTYPEYRVYVVGTTTRVFKIHSPMLDYRLDRNARIEPSDSGMPVSMRAALLRLCASLGVDFGAADFKTDPATGTPVFLELNTSPMFAAFDGVCEGQLATAMTAALLDDAAPRRAAALR